LALFWIPMMAVIAVPNFVKARETAQRIACVNNLRQIDEAKQVWALQHNKDTNNTPTMQDLRPLLKGNVAFLRCPAGGNYAINKIGEPPTCSIPSHRLSTGSSGQPLDFTEHDRLDNTIKNLDAAKTQQDRFYALGAAAKESFVAGKVQDARKYAEELMVVLPSFRGDWNYGNAVQDANLVLGRIALSEGDVESAKRHLIEAGKSPGSPQMDSFGPNMSLAEDLLKKGERQVVLEYFELCRNFWKMDGGKLTAWSKEVKAGKIPDFGANLNY
jgi:competence protein ComGC